MPSQNDVLTALSEQMYRDIHFVAEQNPMQVVDDDTARMFNGLLKEVSKAFPSMIEVCPFEPMTARTLKYKDAVVVMGQLWCLVRVGTGRYPFPENKNAARLAAAVENVPDLPPARRNNEPPDHDVELYGPSPPVGLNEDGTVKFSLDDND